MIDREQLFAQLLSNTGGRPHGSLPNYQEDDVGPLWKYICTMTPTSARSLIQGVLGISVPSAIYLPENSEYIIFRVDDTYLYALTGSRGRYYLIRTEGRRYYHKLLRKYNSSHSQQELYLTLFQMYGVTTSSLPMSRMVA